MKALDRRFGTERQRTRLRADFTEETHRRDCGWAWTGNEEVGSPSLPRLWFDLSGGFCDWTVQNILDYELKRPLFQGKPTSLDEVVEIVAEAEAWYKAEKAGQSRVLIPEATKKDSGCPTTNSDLIDMLHKLMDTQQCQLRKETQGLETRMLETRMLELWQSAAAQPQQSNQRR